jgi:hypothetical protein
MAENGFNSAFIGLTAFTLHYITYCQQYPFQFDASLTHYKYRVFQNELYNFESL